jgi:Ca-activated chloride channel homolog
MNLDKTKRVAKALAPFTGMVLALFFLVLAAPGNMISYAQDPQQDPPPPPKRQPQQPPKPAQEAPPEIGPDEVVRVSFRLEEAGKAQEIAQVGTPDEVPLDIALLFDLSSSVSSRFAFQQQAASRFLKEVLRPTDTATIYAIDSEGRLVQPRGSVDAAVAKLMSFKAATVPTPTAFYDSVKAAATYLAQNAPKDHRRVILVITDGDDNFSAGIKDAAIADYTSKTANTSTASIRETAHATLDALHHRAQLDVQRAVQRADTVFFSINPSGDSIRLNVVSTRAQNGMQSIADATGGSSFVPNTDQDLERVFRQIAAELRAQYLLQYYSNDESPAGKFIPLKVSLPAQPQMKVRARLGYYAKKG